MDRSASHLPVARTRSTIATASAALWPVCVALALCLLCAGPSAAAAGRPLVASYYAAAQQSLLGLPPGYAVLAQAEHIALQRTNAIRANAGLPILQEDRIFSQAARYYAVEMLSEQFFDHQDPEGRSPLDRLTTIHRSFIGGAGENLFRGSQLGDLTAEGVADLILDQLMNSPSHRANILNKDWQVMGFGIVRSGGEIRAVQLFGTPLGYLMNNLPLTFESNAVMPPSLFELENGRVAGVAFLGSRRPLNQVSVKEFNPPDHIVAPFRPGSYQTLMLMHDANGDVKMAYGPRMDIKAADDR